MATLTPPPSPPLSLTQDRAHPSATLSAPNSVAPSRRHGLPRRNDDFLAAGPLRRPLAPKLRLICPPRAAGKVAEPRAPLLEANRPAVLLRARQMGFPAQRPEPARPRRFRSRLGLNNQFLGRRPLVAVDSLGSLSSAARTLYPENGPRDGSSTVAPVAVHPGNVTATYAGLANCTAPLRRDRAEARAQRLIAANRALFMDPAFESDAWFAKKFGTRYEPLCLDCGTLPKWDERLGSIACRCGLARGAGGLESFAVEPAE